MGQNGPGLTNGPCATMRLLVYTKDVFFFNRTEHRSIIHGAKTMEQSQTMETAANRVSICRLISFYAFVELNEYAA
jgi:hypothetical protein